MDNVGDLLQNKQVMMVNISDNILITRADFEEWEELKKSKAPDCSVLLEDYIPSGEAISSR